MLYYQRTNHHASAGLPILEYAETVCDRICTKWDIKLLEFGGEADHIHLLFSAYPNIDLSVANFS